MMVSFSSGDTQNTMGTDRFLLATIISPVLWSVWHFLMRELGQAAPTSGGSMGVHAPFPVVPFGSSV